MIAHGTHDPVISVEWSRRARLTIEQAGAAVVYREAPVGHTIDPHALHEARTLVSSLEPNS